MRPVVEYVLADESRVLLCLGRDGESVDECAAGVRLQYGVDRVVAVRERVTIISEQTAVPVASATSTTNSGPIAVRSVTDNDEGAHCARCGTPLAGKRAGAAFCSNACRQSTYRSRRRAA